MQSYSLKKQSWALAQTLYKTYALKNSPKVDKYLGYFYLKLGHRELELSNLVKLYRRRRRNPNEKVCDDVDDDGEDEEDRIGIQIF